MLDHQPAVHPAALKSGLSSAGFYIALAQGYYKEANLTVTLLNPAQDAYRSTPASRVASGQATFAVAPSETVVSYNSQPGSSSKPRLQVYSLSYGARCVHSSVSRAGCDVRGADVHTEHTLNNCFTCNRLPSKQITCFQGSPVCLQAVAALLQTDTSAIVTLKSSGIDRPGKLDSKTYASYGARY